MARFVFQGGQELDKALMALPAAMEHDLVIEALLEVAEPIRADAASRAPRAKGGGQHLADHIIAAETTLTTEGKRGRMRSVEAHEHTVAIGPSYQPRDFFYGFFQEHGTVKHPAQPFLRPAFDHGAPRALKQLGGILWRLIERSTRRAA